MASQIWATNSLGGFFYSLNLSKELRTALQPESRFRQFCDARSAAGKGKGNTFTWDVVSDIAGTGGTLVETNTMPESNFTITQGTLTITEYGQAVPYSGKLEALSQFEVRQPVMRALRNDATKTLDRAAHTQFNQTQLRYVATTASDTGTLYTNGSATGTNSIAMTKDHVKDIVDKMEERNIPKYMAGDYMAVGRPATLRRLKNDLETIRQYSDPGFGIIMNGEMGRYEQTRFVKQTNILQGIAHGGTAWTNGKSDWVYFMGEDTVTEGIAVPEEIRAKIPGDYGRSKGVAWYALLGFGIVHTAAAESRIVKWDSQA